ncbi:universal stress protein [Streptomyces sp. NBC_00210]|uniref:universal stress protein n=1 Tax=unclassified Streptomyces TaxID=2593676 RepID=UPI0032465147
MHRLVVAGIDGFPESLAAAHWAAREALRRGPDGASPDSDRDSVKTPYRNVVLGLDTSSPCDELIESAFDAAQHRGATLRVIHTFSAPPPYAAVDQPVPKPGPELLAEHEHAVSAALHPWREKFPEVTVTVTVAEGAPSLSFRTADPPLAGGRDS